MRTALDLGSGDALDHLLSAGEFDRSATSTVGLGTSGAVSRTSFGSLPACKCRHALGSAGLRSILAASMSDASGGAGITGGTFSSSKPRIFAAVDFQVLPTVDGLGLSHDTPC